MRIEAYAEAGTTGYQARSLAPLTAAQRTQLSGLLTKLAEQPR